MNLCWVNAEEMQKNGYYAVGNFEEHSCWYFVLLTFDKNYEFYQAGSLIAF